MHRYAIGMVALLAACSGKTQQTGDASQKPKPEVPAAMAETQTAPKSAFRLEQAKDPMNDEDRSFVYSTAVGLPASSFREAAVVWRCHGAEVEFVISAADFLTTAEPVSVQWRFDDRPAEGPSKWPVSTEGTAVFASDSLRILLTDEALKAKRLRVRLTDYQGTYHDYEFSLVGLASALQSLRCTLDPVRRRVAAAEQARVNALAVAARARANAAAARKRDSALAEEWPWVGSAESLTYMPTNTGCWRMWVDTTTAKFFKTESEAKARGFIKSALCK